MKENEFPVLEVSNIDWDKDHDEYEKLPRSFKLTGVQRIGILTKYLNGLVKNLIGYLTASISAKLEPGRIAVVVCAGGCSCC